MKKRKVSGWVEQRDYTVGVIDTQPQPSDHDSYKSSWSEFSKDIQCSQKVSDITPANPSYLRRSDIRDL